MSAASSWDRIRDSLLRRMPSAGSWLASVSAKEEGKSLVLLLSNPFARDVLRERCGAPLEEAVRLEGFDRVVWRVLRAAPSGAGEPFRPAPGNEAAWRILSGLTLRWRPDYHPVVLRGAPGSGKSALLGALAAAAAARRIDPILSTEAVRLSRRIALAAKAGRQAGLRARLRGTRLLLVDGADALRGKTRTQSELVHALDEMRNAGGVAVLAFRGRPEGLDERLLSRLSQGLDLEVDTHQ